MPLVLKPLDLPGPDRAIPVGQPFTMGRGPDNDWVIPDPDREVSKVHCRIEGGDDGFVLIDNSINGTVIEGEGSLERGQSRRLETGDIFVVGRHRFAVATTGVREELPPWPARNAEPVPGDLDGILDGAGEGSETRLAGAVSGEAARWLSELPTGSADAALHRPEGWGEPPEDGRILSPEPETPTDFVDRSERTPAAHTSFQLPQSHQLIPTDWLHDNEGAALNQAPERPGKKPAGIAGGRVAAVADDEARAALLAGARLDPDLVAAVPVDDLFRRAGEALRALLDGLDILEAAQAVAERDCNLPTLGVEGGPVDFFTETRDVVVTLLGESQSGPAGTIARRIAALADRQRALGLTVAEAALHFDAELSPDRIAAEAHSPLRVGALGRAAAWTRYTERYRHLVQAADDAATPGFLALLRRCRTIVTTQRP